MEAHTLEKHFFETSIIPKYQHDWIWKISGFSYFAMSDGYVLDGPMFRIKDSEVIWSLKLKHWSDFCVLTINASTNVTTETFVTTAIVTASGVEVNSATSKYADSGILQTRNFPMSSMSQWISNDTLAIHFNVATVEKSTRSGFRPLADEPNDQAPVSLIESMEAMLEDNKFSDVVLNVASTEFRANKAILSSRSPVFSAMFSTGMLESKTGHVHITDIDVDVFRAFLQFLYTDKLSFNGVDFTLDLLMAAYKYDVQPLKVKCKEQLCNSVTHDDLIRVLLVADACEEKDLTQACLNAIDGEVQLAQFMKYLRQMRSLSSVSEVMERLLMSQDHPDAGQGNSIPD